MDTVKAALSLHNAKIELVQKRKFDKHAFTIKKAKDCELIMHQPTTSTMFAIPTKKVCSAGRQLQR
jgi:hypothetical protein